MVQKKDRLRLTHCLGLIRPLMQLCRGLLIGPRMQLTGRLLVGRPRPMIGCLQEALVRGRGLVREAVGQCGGAADHLGAGDGLRKRLVVAVLLANRIVCLHGQAHTAVGCAEREKQLKSKHWMMTSK